MAKHFYNFTIIDSEYETKGITLQENLSGAESFLREKILHLVEERVQDNNLDIDESIISVKEVPYLDRTEIIFQIKDKFFDPPAEIELLYSFSIKEA